jgi:outer membrane protein OmpA-like peptidoglycan-associated protein/Tol biopolymer transport system component
MAKLKLKWLFILFSLATYYSFSQTPKYSSSNQSAINAFERGLKELDGSDRIKAIPYFEKALNKDSNFLEPYMALGDIYADQNDLGKAIELYRKFVSIDPDFYPNALYLLGSYELRDGQYQASKEHLMLYQTKANNIPTTKRNTIQRMIASCDFSMEAIQHPVPYNPVNLGAGVNTDGGEYYPSLTVDQKKIIFTRRFKDDRMMGRYQEDFYISTKFDSVWQKAINPGGPLNTMMNEGAPSISADGKVVFYAACNRPDGIGNCDIYLSQMLSDVAWSQPMNLGAPINTTAWETQPSFSSDGRTLYFIRGYTDDNRKKVQDIFMSTYTDENRWSDPVRLSDSINSPGSEESVFIHPDNQTLYFSSDGHPGLGGLDLFMSKRRPDGSWGKAINLGYPINTNADENSLIVSPDGQLAFMSSTRKDGFGDLDMYSFELYPSVRPAVVSYVKGVVVDDKTGNPLQAKFEIVDVRSGLTVMSDKSDKKKGEFLACLPTGKEYMLNVSKEGYLFYSDYFNCMDVTDEQHAYKITARLKQPIAGETVVMKNIFFDNNKYDLKTESFSELNKLVAFLKSSPNVSIEIGGHTDAVGDAKLNLALSENRAKSVYNYLVEKGIATTRLSFKGFGSTVPVADNGTEEGRAKNRRTEFKIK